MDVNAEVDPCLRLILVSSSSPPKYDLDLCVTLQVPEQRLVRAADPARQGRLRQVVAGGKGGRTVRQLAQQPPAQRQIHRSDIYTRPRDIAH